MQDTELEKLEFPAGTAGVSTIRRRRSIDTRRRDSLDTRSVPRIVWASSETVCPSPWALPTGRPRAARPPLCRPAGPGRGQESDGPPQLLMESVIGERRTANRQSRRSVCARRPPRGRDAGGLGRLAGRAGGAWRGALGPTPPTRSCPAPLPHQPGPAGSPGIPARARQGHPSLTVSASPRECAAGAGLSWVCRLPDGRCAAGGCCHGAGGESA